MNELRWKKDKGVMKKIMHYTKRLLLVFISTPLFGIDIGSDSAVTRFNTQQTLNNNDRIAGSAQLMAGFVLANSSVTATFDSFFPVTGSISLAHGTLLLNRDLVLRDISTILELGNIVGNSYGIEFSSSVTCIPNLGGVLTNVNMSDVNLFLKHDVYWPQESIHFSGNCLIDGQGYCLTLAPNSTIFVDSGASLMFKDITIQKVSGSKIQMLDTLSTISLNNAQYVLDGNYSFTEGKLVVLNDFVVSGEGYTFAYLTDQVSTVSTDGRLIFDNDVTFSFVPRVSSQSQLNLLDTTSEFVLRGATLYTSTTGLRLTTGKLVIERVSALYNQGTVESEAISFANTLDIQVFPAATLDYLNGMIVYE